MENRNSSISSVIIRKNGENSCNNELALTQEKNGEEKNSNQMIIDDDAITSNNNCNNEDDKKPINNQQQGQPSMSNNANNNNRLKYGRVVILLENPILPAEMIENTPSKADNLDPLIENDLRITGCKLIQISGILLRLPQVAMATGQVLFQRFYYNKSFVRQSMEITAMACVVLASKVEEAPRRIRDIINVFHNMKQIRLKQPITPILLDENYIHLKNQIIKSERRILKELGFCVHVKHPHKFIVAVAQILKNEHNSQLIQTAWSYMNDSLQTNVFVRYPPETIACACIHLSSRVLRVPLPTRPLWYELFNVTSENIEDICKSILMLYTRKPLDQEELEAIVEKAKQKLDEEKLKARVLLAQRNNQLSVNDVAINSPQTIDSRSNSPSVIILNKNNSDNKASNDKVISEEKDVNNLPNNSEIEKQDDKSDHSTNSSSSLKLQKSPLKSNEKEKSSMKRLLEDQHEEERYHNSSDDQQIYKTYRTKKDGHSITSNNYKEYNDYDDNCPDDHLRLKKDIYPKRDNRSPQIPRSYISSKIVDTNSYRRERDTRDRNHYHYRSNIRSRSRSRSPNDQSPYDQSYVSSSSSSSSKVTNRHHHYYYDNRRKDMNRVSSSKNRSSNDYELKYYYDDEMKNSSSYNRYHHSNHRRYEYREKKRDYSPTDESQSSSSRYHHNSYGEKY